MKHPRVRTQGAPHEPSRRRRPVLLARRGRLRPLPLPVRLLRRGPGPVHDRGHRTRRRRHPRPHHLRAVGGLLAEPGPRGGRLLRRLHQPAAQVRGLAHPHPGRPHLAELHPHRGRPARLRPPTQADRRRGGGRPRIDLGRAPTGRRRTARRTHPLPAPGGGGGGRPVVRRRRTPASRAARLAHHREGQRDPHVRARAHDRVGQPSAFRWWRVSSSRDASHAASSPAAGRTYPYSTMFAGGRSTR